MVLCKDLNYLDPTIKPFVDELFASELFPQHDIEIVSTGSGSSQALVLDNGHCDRFKLILPFAGYSITWEVIFDGSCPDIAPDFIFEDESFLCDSIVEAVPSLVNWPSSKEKSLVCVVSELLKLYTKYQWQAAEKSMNPYLGKWLDLDNAMNDNWKVEILNGGHKAGPYSPSGRQRNILPSGYTSVVIEVPMSSEAIDSNGLLFYIQYIFKSTLSSMEHKIILSPELKTWLGWYTENNIRRNKLFDISKTTLSETAHTYLEALSQMLTKSIDDYNERKDFQLSLFHSIKFHEEQIDLSILEFDFDDFKFSSCLFQGKIIFNVDFRSGSPKGQILEIADDGSYKKRDVPEETLMDPHFNILEFLTAAPLSPASAAPTSPASAPTSPPSAMPTSPPPPPSTSE